MVLICQGGSIRAKVVVFGQKCLTSGKVVVCTGKSCCFRAKWLYSSKKMIYSGEEVLFGQSGCLRAEVVVCGKK